MKKIWLAILCLLLTTILSPHFISLAFAGGEENQAQSTTDSQKDGTNAQDHAVLEQLKTLLSEDYCPNNKVKEWNNQEPVPECLLQQAKKVRVAVFGPPDFSKEEEMKIQRVLEQEVKVREIMEMYKCPPNVEEEWAQSKIQKPAPKCVLARSEKLQALRPDGSAFEVLDVETSKKLHAQKLLDFKISELISKKYPPTNIIQNSAKEFLQEIKAIAQ